MTGDDGSRPSSRRPATSRRPTASRTCCARRVDVAPCPLQRRRAAHAAHPGGVVDEIDDPHRPSRAAVTIRSRRRMRAVSSNGFARARLLPDVGHPGGQRVLGGDEEALALADGHLGVGALGQQPGVAGGPLHRGQVDELLPRAARDADDRRGDPAAELHVHRDVPHRTGVPLGRRLGPGVRPLGRHEDVAVGAVVAPRRPHARRPTTCRRSSSSPSASRPAIISGRAVDPRLLAIAVHPGAGHQPVRVQAAADVRRPAVEAVAAGHRLGHAAERVQRARHHGAAVGEHLLEHRLVDERHRTAGRCRRSRAASRPSRRRPPSTGTPRRSRGSSGRARRGRAAAAPASSAVSWNALDDLVGQPSLPLRLVGPAGRRAGRPRRPAPALRRAPQPPAHRIPGSADRSCRRHGSSYAT